MNNELLIPYLDFFRNVTKENIHEIGPRLAEALQAIGSGVTNMAQQVNANPNGQPEPPPAISGVDVSAMNGHLSVAIQDDNPKFRGVRYFIETADNPNFTNPTIVDNGTSRNYNKFVGNKPMYVRAYSAYGPSAPSSPAYYGSQVEPRAVLPGSDNAGAPAMQSQSSGTGVPGQGLTGPGIVPFHSTDGRAPKR